MMNRLSEEQGGDLISVGIVVCVYESAFDVLIPEYGFEKRVHCDQLPLKKAEFDKNKRLLELYWEKGVPSSAFVPEDERPQAKHTSQEYRTSITTASRRTDSSSPPVLCLAHRACSDSHSPCLFDSTHSPPRFGSLAMDQQGQQQQQGPQGSGGRRLHIAHRRSPSEMTPLMSTLF
jgi:hypothetical protein